MNDASKVYCYGVNIGQTNTYYNSECCNLYISNEN